MIFLQTAFADCGAVDRECQRSLYKFIQRPFHSASSCVSRADSSFFCRCISDDLPAMLVSLALARSIQRSIQPTFCSTVFGSDLKRRKDPEISTERGGNSGCTSCCAS